MYVIRDSLGLSPTAGLQEPGRPANSSGFREASGNNLFNPHFIVAASVDGSGNLNDSRGGPWVRSLASETTGFAQWHVFEWDTAPAEPFPSSLASRRIQYPPARLLRSQSRNRSATIQEEVMDSSEACL